SPDLVRRHVTRVAADCGEIRAKRPSVLAIEDGIAKNAAVLERGAHQVFTTAQPATRDGICKNDAFITGVVRPPETHRTACCIRANVPHGQSRESGGDYR